MIIYITIVCGFIVLGGIISAVKSPPELPAKYICLQPILNSSHAKIKTCVIIGVLLHLPILIWSIGKLTGH